MLQARMFVTVNNFHPRLQFAGKATSLRLVWSPVRGSILACFYLLITAVKSFMMNAIG